MKKSSEHYCSCSCSIDVMWSEPSQSTKRLNGCMRLLVMSRSDPTSAWSPLTQALAICSYGTPLDEDIDGLEGNLPSDAGGNCTHILLTQPRCTPNVSSAIVHRYPSLRLLLDAFDACVPEEAPQLLASLVCDGRTQRSLGLQLSRRMYMKLMTGIYAVFSSQDAKASLE